MSEIYPSFIFNYEIKETANKGEGVFSKSNSKKSTLLFVDRPLIAIQSVLSKQRVLACAFCFSFIGSLDLQFNLLSGRIKRSELNNFIQPPIFPDHGKHEPYFCQNGCGEAYCSEICFENHYKRSHYLLCCGLVSETSPLTLFKRHAIETNEIFLLVAETIATIISSLESYFSSIEYKVSDLHSNPLEYFFSKPWWEIAVLPECLHKLGDKCSHCSHFRISLKDCALESLNLLKEAIFETHPLKSKIYHLFEIDFYGKMIGIFELNQIEIIRRSPLNYYAEMVQNATTQTENDPMCDLSTAKKSTTLIERDRFLVLMKEIFQFLDAQGTIDDKMVVENFDTSRFENHLLWSSIDQIFPPFEGYGLFNIVSKMNHSCSPSVSTSFDDPFCGDPIFNSGPCLCYVISNNLIQIGDEMTHSYIDVDIEYYERQRELRDYGFICECERCIEESRML